MYKLRDGRSLYAVQTQLARGGKASAVGLEKSPHGGNAKLKMKGKFPGLRRSMKPARIHACTKSRYGRRHVMSRGIRGQPGNGGLEIVLGEDGQGTCQPNKPTQRQANISLDL